jgi:arylformamidase
MPLKIIDLSHSIHTGMPVYPGDSAPIITSTASLGKQGYRESKLVIGTHIGTHIDAPAHIVPGGLTLDAFPAEKFVGSGRVVDCRNAGIITVEKIAHYLTSMIPDFILIYTGLDRLWGRKSYFRQIPVIDPGTAYYLCSLPIKGVGIDAPSFDPVGSESLSNHKQLLGNNILLIENLTGLDQLLEKKFIFSCLPMNIKDADGSPVRATAIIR